jgi:hypothetical protein
MSSASEEDSSKIVGSLDFEKRLAGLVWQEKKLAEKVPAAIFEHNFSDQVANVLFVAIKSNKDIEKLSAADRSKLDLYAMEATADFDLNQDGIVEEEFNDLIKNFISRKKDQIKKEFAEKIAVAESGGDIPRIKELMSELQSAILDEK